MAVQASPIFLGHAVWQCESQAAPTRAEQNRQGGTGTGTATSHHSAALHCATALSCLPAVKVSVLCPNHLLFTKALTHILKQKNNSIMCLAGCALFFWFTVAAPHWKDPHAGGEKKKSKAVSSKHTYYQSLISTKHRLPWDLMQLMRGENTNKQTKSSSISRGRGWGNRTSGIFVEELHKTNGLGELKSMGRGQFVTDHCHLNMACWQLNEEQNKKGMCFIWAGLVPCVHSQWKIQSKRESVSLPAQLSTHITPWHTPQDLLQAHKWGHYFFTCWKK